MNIQSILKLDENYRWMLFNTIYQVDRESKRWSDEIFLIFKNIDTGEKIFKKIKSPKIEVYIADEGSIDERYNHTCTDISHTKRYDVTFMSKEKEIADILGGDALAEYNKCKMRGEYREAREVIAKHPRVFSSDKNIEDFYRFKCVEQYGLHDFEIDTSFIDIEADIKLGELDIKHALGNAPINVVTIVSPKLKRIYTLAWDYSILPPDLPHNEEIVSHMMKQSQAIRDAGRTLPDKWLKIVKDKYGEKYDDYKLSFAMFNSELDILKSIFEILHNINPDVCAVWNLSYDFRYIYNRIRDGYDMDPKDIMGHPDFKSCNVLEYHQDNRTKDITVKGDYCTIPGYTVWLCQMLLFGCTRKGRDKIERLSLDFIAKREVGHEKLDYSHLASHIKDFAYASYETFILYNMLDVLPQVAIDNKVRDIHGLMLTSYQSATRYNKCFKENQLLVNIAHMNFLLEQDMILGNNINALIAYAMGEELDEDDEGFEGAFIADPMLNDNVGVSIYKGTKSRNLFDACLDYDYTALYPTIQALINIFTASMVGKVIIEGNPSIRERLSVLASKPDEEDDEVTNKKKKKKKEKGVAYDRGSQFIQDLEVNETLMLLYKWFNMPAVTDVMNMIDENNPSKIIIKAKPKKKKKTFKCKFKKKGVK